MRGIQAGQASAVAFIAAERKKERRVVIIVFSDIARQRHKCICGLKAQTR
jgi:hypothetical protein